MKIRCFVEFVFDSGEQTIEQVEEYLKDCPGECLEWMIGDAIYTFTADE